ICSNYTQVLQIMGIHRIFTGLEIKQLQSKVVKLLLAMNVKNPIFEILMSGQRFGLNERYMVI
ncbi:MAG TPA: hypothetical protein DDW81_11315, partial [Cryomorphaceae bacterium]|nr:hypothetical protein [Cryomorphaceae bacterium]